MNEREKESVGETERVCVGETEREKKKSVCAGERERACVIVDR